ncbi:RING-type E3 ubiquitin-protein ligase PPIL2-like [Salvelinus namaycush]|uniref:Peptidyl-prolyl cis-trans isomerase n=1 Tax=Salvelinus namaycush TaxID=8040 RepID=A0A8U0Q8P4_SALNM|nr:RING-type E3 ubiquitin-protein ligase PPIL2-like [Salvelinus namaycush]
MANSGPNTNKSQFFITFRSCPYLDRKHTVFGRVVGGFEALTAMENIEADPKTDKPKSEIKLLSATVFVDPYDEADAQIAAERQKELDKQEEDRAQSSASQRKTKADQTPKTFKAGIGKYINPVTTTTTKRPAAEDSGPTSSGATSGAKKAKGKTGFGDFSSW